MEVIPAIDLRGGKVVRLHRGYYDQQTTYSDDPISVARRFYEQGAKSLHVIDLDGARDGLTTSLSFVAAVKKLGVGIRVEFGGGIRTLGMVEAALDCGVDLVIVGTAAHRDANFLQALIANHKNQVAVALDVRKESVLIEGWLAETDKGPMETVVSKLNGVGRIVYTDTERDGTLEGINLEHISFSRVVNRCEERGIKIQYAGGVRDIDDVKRLIPFEKRGVDALIVGKGLYAGTFDLSEALKLVSRS